MIRLECSIRAGFAVVDKRKGQLWWEVRSAIKLKGDRLFALFQTPAEQAPRD
jgi:hypothetical protein